MKKLTAEVAKRLTNKSTASEAKTFQDAINFIASEAKLGHTSTFIDGKLKDLEVIKAELEERGFRCYIEQTGFPPSGPKFLSVEW